MRTSKSQLRPRRPRLSTQRGVAVALGISTQLVACDDSPGTKTVQSLEGSELPVDDAAVYEPDICRRRDDGEECGRDRHCIAGRCHFNTCGDTIVAGDEQCDDGDEVRGDGCTPSCRVEMKRCEDGQWVKVDEECEAGVEADAGIVGHPAPEDCPQIIRMVVGPRAAPVGEVIGLAARSAGDVLWMSKDADDPVASSEYIASPGSLETEFTCPNEGKYTIILLTSAQNCPTEAREVAVNCTKAADPGTEPAGGGPSPDAGVPDAGADAGTTDAGPSLLDAGPDAGLPDAGSDAGGPEPDASLQPDAGLSPDAGFPTDAGPQPDAGLQPDAGPQPDAGQASRFRSAACETCVEAACVDYSGVDLAGPCFQGVGFDPAFAQACSDVYFCSHNSADRCAYNTERGPVGCFCGESVSVDDCQKGTIQGSCIPEWYAAAQCPSGDHNCVLNSFVNLPLPAAYANFMIECQNTMCASECAP